MRQDIIPAIFDSLTDGILIVDPDERIVFANQTFSDMFMLSDMPIGANISTLLPGVTPLPDREEFPAAFDFQESDKYIEVLVTEFGTEPGWMLTVRDVTLHRQREKVLLTNERRYRALFENMSDAMLILDDTGHIITASPRTADMFHYAPDDLLEKPIYDFMSEQDHKIIRRCIRHLLTGKTLPLFEQEFIQGETLFFAEVVMTLVRDLDHNPGHIQMLIRDISERKWAQDKLQTRVAELAILQRVDEGINQSLSIDTVLHVALDAAMTHSDADAGYIAVLDSDTEQVTIRATAGYPENRIDEVLHYEQGISGRILRQHNAELVLDVHQDTDYIPIMAKTDAVMILPLLAGEQLIGLLTLETSEVKYFTDETFGFVRMLAGRIAIGLENARLYSYVQQELREIEKLYEEKSHLEQLKTDMIRIASHDLKNPLSIIAAYVNMLRDDKEQINPIYHIFFDEMQNAVDRQWAILEDILSMERIQERAAGDNMTLLNLSMLSEFTVTEYQSQSERKHQTYIVDLALEPPLMVYGDEVQLREAISNLIVNAIKYTPEGGEIDVYLYQEEEYVCFEVRDTGYGIPEKRQKQLFEPFYRAKANGTENIDGTGLGLYLVKNIIERHQGEVLFESVYQQGSRFGFKMPLRDSSNDK
ncbi:MAG: ATP-binding protein [Aggregatilineales bacterium]